MSIEADVTTEVYDLTLTLTGEAARSFADAVYSGTCASQRRTALISVLRDYGAVEAFTRTERHLAVYNLLESE